MPIDEQKIILNLKNNLEHKPITADDLPGINRIGLLPDDTIHFEYDPITIYGKQPDMIDNTIGTPTKGIRDKALSTLGVATASLMALPVLAEIGGGLAATEMGPVILANIGRFGWKVLNHPITQTIGTIDGFRNLLSGNGVQKTYNHFKNGEWGRGSLSLAGDILDASPLIGITKSVPYIYKYFKNTPVEKISSFDDVVDKSIDYWHRQIDPNVRKSDYVITERDLTGANVESAAWKGGITKRYLSDIVLPNKIDSGIKYMTKNNDILKERLWKTYNRDLGISQNLEFFPPKQNGIVKDNTIMLIHGDPASTGVYTTASGIGRGTSTIHHYPTMNNGKLYPTKDVYQDYFGPVQNKIFWGENKPHGWSLTKSFDTFIDDLKHIDHKILSSTDKKVLYSHSDMTTSEIPYRFIFGDAKKLNGIERNTPNALGTEWITNDVNLKDLNGLEWNPFLGVWEKHIYQSGDHVINSELTDGIPIIWVDK